MRLPLLLLLPLILAGCTIDPVKRTVALAPHVDLPAGLVELGHDGALWVEPGEIEPLLADHAYVAWASTATDSVYLGRLSDEAPLDVAVSDFGIEGADIEQLRITIEETASLPLDHPSAPPVLEATLSHPVLTPLAIPDMEEEALSESTATAVLENSHVVVSSMGLPTLPSALFYGVWLHFEASADGAPTAEPPGGHSHAAGAGKESETSAAPVFAGRLDPTGALDVELPVFAAGAQAMTICVEARHGVDAASPSCVLQGTVVLTSGGAATDAAEHVH